MKRVRFVAGAVSLVLAGPLLGAAPAAAQAKEYRIGANHGAVRTVLAAGRAVPRHV